MKINKTFYTSLMLGLLIIVSACSANNPSPEAGQNLATLKGCNACHSIDGTPKVGPTWQGLYNSQVELANGDVVLADDAYLAESITSPNEKIVSGYSVGAMPPITLTDEDIANLVAYIKSIQ